MLHDFIIHKYIFWNIEAFLVAYKENMQSFEALITLSLHKSANVYIYNQITIKNIWIKSL